MADQGFSPQDLQDLTAIRKQIPDDDPRAAKIDAVIGKTGAPPVPNPRESIVKGVDVFGSSTPPPKGMMAKQTKPDPLVGGLALAGPVVMGGAEAASALRGPAMSFAAKHPVLTGIGVTSGINMARQIPYVGKMIPPGAGEIAGYLTATNPGEPEAELGSPENPGPHSKLPTRIPASVLRNERMRSRPISEPYSGERTGQPYMPNPHYEPPPPPAAPIPARKGLMLPPAPPEVESPSTALVPRMATMPRPLRPTVGTPEDFQVYDNQMSRLKQEASDAGTFSAARGKVGKPLDYQQRIGKRLSKGGRSLQQP